LAELTIHAALIRQGYTVEVHPPCPHPTRRPDFLAKDIDGNPVAYVEVTMFGPAQEIVGQSNREAAIYNAIDRTTLPPGFRLSYDVVSYGQSSPNVGTLCREIETWAVAGCVYRTLALSVPLPVARLVPGGTVRFAPFRWRKGR
jgi:hypothetical protein